MRIKTVKVENFRSLYQLEVPLSQFVCVVGHNNSGKSSLLIALSLLRSGTKLTPSDYYDPSKDAAITAVIEGIDEDALNLLGEEHRDRIRALVLNSGLTLVRRYSPDGTPSLRCVVNAPTEPRFQDEYVSDLVKGKKGPELRSTMAAVYPEVADQVEAMATQAACHELVAKMARNLPPESFSSHEIPLPTGIANSVVALLPEPIYIHAVNDISDQIKTKEAASFGKILKILLDLIAQTEQMTDVTNSFERLNRMLNVVRSGGQTVDERMPEVRGVEATLHTYLKEQFRDVKLEIDIPPPDLRTILGAARIFVDDGIRDVVETKGDGLKRAVTFALLRTYVDLHAHMPRASAESKAINNPRYLFLFEEPELYLHPEAQRILYDALVEISRDQQVCVSTHSPYFFSAHGTGTFIRLRKDRPALVGFPPASAAHPVDLLQDLSKRDAFQIICYEANSAAFFCRRIVLVEGDCDVIYLTHVARALNRAWDFDQRNIAVVRVGGKGNFGRYRKFFNCFDVDVRIIADLDAIVDQFEKLGPDEESSRLHTLVMQRADALIQNGTGIPELNRDQIEGITAQRRFRERYNRCKGVAAKIALGSDTTPEELRDFSELFLPERNYMRAWVLRNCGSVRTEKEALLRALRASGIHVLSGGSIEDYHPAGTTGEDKPTRALAACSRIGSRADAVACCPVLADPSGIPRPEFDLIFDDIFAR